MLLFFPFSILKDFQLFLFLIFIYYSVDRAGIDTLFISHESLFFFKKNV